MMQIDLELLGVTLSTESDVRAAYEDFIQPVGEREYQERAIRHLAVMAMMRVFMFALKEIGDSNVEDPADFAYKAMYDATKITPELIAEHIGHSGYGEVLN